MIIPPADGGAVIDEAKEEAILRAAVELFARQAFGGTTVPEIAVRAGVGVGTLYRYHPSKEEIVNAVYRRWKSALLEHLFVDFPKDAPYRAQFRELFFRLVDFARQNPDPMAFLELHQHGDYLDDPSRALAQRSHERIVAHIGRAQRDQQLVEGDPELVFAVVWGSFIGLVRAAREGRITLDDATISAASERVWSAVRS
jgi:TetR/AcrR family transcriptional regulator, repressor of fatR-cypB operon